MSDLNTQPQSSSDPAANTLPLGSAPPSARTSMPTSFDTISPSIALQDLSGDTLISRAPRTQANGMAMPTLGGIQLLAKLGQGGMGAVYYGIHPRLNKEVAVKVLPSQIAEDNPEAIERFFREAQIAAKVQSPHLVNVTDVNQDGELFYLIMEFVSGESAGSLLKKAKKAGKPGLPEDIALDICIAATTGLAAAHEEGVIHRDIKPDNIMVPIIKGGEGLNYKAAKLADLGLARNTEVDKSLTAAQSCMGTPGFLSPEQAQDARNCGKPADIFSMGATVYALLAGVPPFAGETLMKILLATMQEAHPPIRRVRPDVSAATAALIDTCLSKVPGKRYADGAALIEALKLCRASLGQSDAAQQEAVQKVRQRPKPAAAAGAGADKPVAQPKPSPSSAQSAPAKKSSTAMLVAIPIVLLLCAGIFWATHRGAASASAAPEPSSSTPPAATSPATSEASSNDTPKPAPPAAVSTPVTPSAPVESSLDLGSGVKMEFVQVAAGGFGLKKFLEFQIGKFPVTKAQFRCFVKDAAYKTTAEKQGSGKQLVKRQWTDVPGASWENAGFKQGDDHPVVMVSYDDAIAFAEWLAKKSGKRVEVPTEVEWQYAGHGPQITAYPWGDAWNEALTNHADVTLQKNPDSQLPENVLYSTDNDGFAFTAPVGSFKNANWCGAYDMAGNVWQWCRHPLANLDPTKRHLRGGAWDSAPEHCRLAHYITRPPDFRSSAVGFRVMIRARN